MAVGADGGTGGAFGSRLDCGVMPEIVEPWERLERPKYEREVEGRENAVCAKVEGAVHVEGRTD